ncbi:MAG: hypothetical protein HY611_05385, partial [Elusimicrobia bacterium]|nr:hypothetical protein [Elusimicrobiota bacterium]
MMTPLRLAPLLMPFLAANLFALSPASQFAAGVEEALESARKDARAIMIAAAAQADSDAPLTVKLNINSVDASRGDVDATQVLKDAGIKIRVKTEGTMVCIQNACFLYEGKAVVPPAPDRPNVLTHKLVNGPISFTLEFSRPVCAFSFTRPALIAGEHGVSHPRWAAQAFGKQGEERAMAGEDLIRYFVRTKPKSALPVTLEAKDPANPIAAVRISSDGNLYGVDEDGRPGTVHFAGFSGV